MIGLNDKPANERQDSFRDGPLFFIGGGGTIFGTCRQFFSK